MSSIVVVAVSSVGVVGIARVVSIAAASSIQGGARVLPEASIGRKGIVRNDSTSEVCGVVGVVRIVGCGVAVV